MRADGQAPLAYALTGFARRFFLCVARVGGVLRSGWAVPGTKELLTMSAVKPRLAALCMFGGLDSTSPDDLNRAFLKHRENVTSFLMQSQMLRNSQDLSCVAGYCADGGCAGGSFRENDPSRPHDDLSMPQRHASTQVQLASEHYSHSVHHMLGDAAERRRASDAAAANPAKRAPLQLSAPETTGRHATLPARVDILLAHRCGHKACVCETECLAVHEVEPRLPCRFSVCEHAFIRPLSVLDRPYQYPLSRALVRRLLCACVLHVCSFLLS